MIKVTPILSRTIECPICRTKTMRLSHNPSIGKEYFDDKCHSYFGVDELVNQFGYDLGDFYSGNNTEIPLRKFAELHEKERLMRKQADCQHLHIEKFPPFVPEIFVQYHTCLDCGEKLSLAPLPAPALEDVFYSTNWFDTESVSTFLTDELVWRTEAQKQEAYEIVTRMFLGIPEFEEGCGNQGIDIGLVGYPI